MPPQSPVRTLAAILAAVVAAQATDIYVSTSGSDSNSGTSSSPYASLQMAVDAASAGDTIYLRGGTYNFSENVQIDAVCTSSAPCTIRAYPGESVILDGEDLPYTPADLDASLPNSDRGILHVQDAAFWYFYDLELINGPYGVYIRDSDSTHWERISTHDNYESGFQIQGSSAHNSVYYLDSYRNRDPRKNGESADGFACKEGDGDGNILKGARLWDNVDDGLDLWEFRSAVTIEDTISWGNGFNRWGFDDFGGDGNGFKLGGGNEGDTGPADHVVRNCIAWGNSAKGFTDNSQEGDFVVKSNTAWENGDSGFEFDDADATLTKNLAVGNDNSEADLDGQTESGNSWNTGSSYTNSSFKSIDVSLVRGDRMYDGRIEPSDFLLLAGGADLGATTHWD
ncbi:pectate lyase [Zalerion maritima]|uniref:Pectate lyase n=1 Tax=Zalerion maritima TaxID=339359 RepID=A0AAD5RKB6_9PEZI|nr:pectate lyase [Zalerion maritima]